MVTFGDRVYILTNQANPYLVNAPNLLQRQAVPAFLKGLRNRNAAQEAMKFREPKYIQEAVVTVMHIEQFAVTSKVTPTNEACYAFAAHLLRVQWKGKYRSRMFE